MLSVARFTGIVIRKQVASKRALARSNRAIMSDFIPRLLQLAVVPRGTQFEWLILDQDDVVTRGLQNTREAAQEHGDNALFEALSPKI